LDRIRDISSLCEFLANITLPKTVPLSGLIIPFKAPSALTQPALAALTDAEETTTATAPDKEWSLAQGQPLSHPGSAVSSEGTNEANEKVCEASVWKGSPMWPKQEEVSLENVRDGLFRLQSPQGLTTVCTPSGGGWTLQQGVLELEDDVSMLLDSSCDEVTIKAAEFKGVCFLKKLTHGYCLMKSSAFYVL
jgi:hypothetical protein